MSEKVTRRELEDALQDMRRKVDDIKVLAANLEGKKRAELEERVKKLEAGNLLQRVGDLQSNFIALHQAHTKLTATVTELVRANNATSTVVSCVERFLDKEHDGWDEGEREAVQRKAELLRERARLARIPEEKKDLSPEELRNIGNTLWEIAKELGSEGTDVPMVLSLYLKSRDSEAARAFVEEVQASEIGINKEVEDLMQKLLDRLGEFEAEEERKPRIVTP